MADGIKIEVDDAAAQGLLTMLAAAGRDLSAPLREIGDALRTSTLQRFQTESGPGGTAWPPMAKSTRRRRGAGAKRLPKSGHLRDSINYRVEGDTMILSANKEYAAIHQFGGTIEMPARSQQQFLRQNRRTGELGNRFVKKKDANFARWATIGAHQIHIPARPFLGVDGADRAAIGFIAFVHFNGVETGFTIARRRR